MALTDKKRRFVDALLSGASNRESAIAAGYSEKTASQAGSKLAKDPDVLAEVGRRLKQKQASSTEVKPSRKVKDEQPRPTDRRAVVNRDRRPASLPY
ncbi:terminase small subunit [Pseudomonas sp. 13.2]|uniref:Terminase small subunit n=1 Tax=Pseudomonas sp. 13.2 TaxID=3144665 RepID=A0AAU7BIA2_9PSED